MSASVAAIVATVNSLLVAMVLHLLSAGGVSVLETSIRHLLAGLQMSFIDRSVIGGG